MNDTTRDQRENIHWMHECTWPRETFGAALELYSNFLNSLWKRITGNLLTRAKTVIANKQFPRAPL